MEQAGTPCPTGGSQPVAAVVPVVVAAAPEAAPAPVVVETPAPAPRPRRPRRIFFGEKSN